MIIWQIEFLVLKEIMKNSLKEPSKYALPFVQLQLNWKMRIMKTEVLQKY